MQAAQYPAAAAAETTDPAAGPMAQFLYEAFHSAAIGGSVIALFFLALDSLAGRPLFTPSLIGTSLFTAVAPGSVTEVRLDMVAYFSGVHFGSFLLLGAVVSKMCRWTGLSTTSPTSVTALVFVLLTGGFLLASWIAMPGAGSVIGIQWVFLANLVTAVAMAIFFYREHLER